MEASRSINGHLKVILHALLMVTTTCKNVQKQIFYETKLFHDSCSIDKQDCRGYSLLHWSAKANKTELVEVLRNDKLCGKKIYKHRFSLCFDLSSTKE